jgi:hypothetical protein
MIQGNQRGIEFSGTHQLLVYIDGVNVMGENISYIYKEPVLDTSKEKIMYIFSHQNVGQNCNIKINPLVMLQSSNIWE